MALSSREMVRMFRALSDPTRVEIVQLVSKSPRNVTELTSLVGVSQPKVSRHLKILRDAGLLNDVRKGKWVWYEIAPLPGGEAVSTVAGALSLLFGGGMAESFTSLSAPPESAFALRPDQTARPERLAGPRQRPRAEKPPGKPAGKHPGARAETHAAKRAGAARRVRKPGSKPRQSEAPQSRPAASRTPARDIEDFLL